MLSVLTLLRHSHGRPPPTFLLRFGAWNVRPSCPGRRAGFLMAPPRSRRRIEPASSSRLPLGGRPNFPPPNRSQGPGRGKGRDGGGRIISTKRKEGGGRPSRLSRGRALAQHYLKPKDGTDQGVGAKGGGAVGFTVTPQSQKPPTRSWSKG